MYTCPGRYRHRYAHRGVENYIPVRHQRLSLDDEVTALLCIFLLLYFFLFYFHREHYLFKEKKTISFSKMNAHLMGLGGRLPTALVPGSAIIMEMAFLGLSTRCSVSLFYLDFSANLYSPDPTNLINAETFALPALAREPTHHFTGGIIRLKHTTQSVHTAMG